MTKPLFLAIRILAIFLAILAAIPAVLWLTASWRNFGLAVAVGLIGAVIVSSILRSVGGGGQTEFGDGSGE